MNPAVTFQAVSVSSRLQKALKQELETLGLTNILLTDHCYVYAKLPATPGMENCKSIGFIAHMDTAPDFSGKRCQTSDHSRL